MDSIERERFLTSLGLHGYPLFSRQDIAEDAVKTLAQLIESDDQRLLEGFPVVLANSLLSSDFGSEQLQSVGEGASSGALRKRYELLAAVTFHLMKSLPDVDRQRKTLKDFLEKRNPAVLSDTKSLLLTGDSINVGKVKLSAERLETIFRNYVVSRYLQESRDLTKNVEQKRRSSLEKALAELFTEKQRSIMEKLLSNERLTKTEQEYYSRVIKRRLRALMNNDVQQIAASLLGP